VVVMADPLVEVAVRVYADFTEHATLAEVLAVIGRCRTDLDTPSAAALPELIERLARQRLTDRIIRQLAPDAGQDHPGYIGSAGLARGIRLREADQDLQDAIHPPVVVASGSQPAAFNNLDDDLGTSPIRPHVNGHEPPQRTVIAVKGARACQCLKASFTFSPAFFTSALD